MATFDDYDGVYFTIQAIRAYHKLTNVEFLVLDNNPGSPHQAAIKHLLTSVPQSKYVEVADRKSSWVKYDAFKHASGDVVLGLDCHVLLEPGFFEALYSFFENDENRLNMLTGPVVYNNLISSSSGLNTDWNKHDFGTWRSHPEDKLGKPFEIQMQGMGCFAIRRDAWQNVSPCFLGFGAEEWYMAEHVRRWGGKVICHPDMRWIHRFGWPKRTFPLGLESKVRNYYVGWLDLYGSLDHPMIQKMSAHWLTQMTEEKLNHLIEGAKIQIEQRTPQPQQICQPSTP